MCLCGASLDLSFQQPPGKRFLAGLINSNHVLLLSSQFHVSPEIGLLEMLVRTSLD